METTEYLKLVFRIMKRMEKLSLTGEKMHFNNSEMRLIEEVAVAKVAGERIISTQIAKALGVTRSAVSQMVNKLEERNVVKRVPDKIDRKIAFIELTDEANQVYEEEKDRLCGVIDKVIEEMGQEKFETFLALANEFVNLIDKNKEPTEEKAL